MNAFDKMLDQRLEAEDIGVLQVNVGLACNQACTHCHLECSPAREESMSWKTMEKVIGAARKIKPDVVDITGGAPEMNPNLQRFISALLADGHTVQVRTNLTAMLEEGQANMPAFFSDNRIKLVASLPCYLDENVCKMRGTGVFEKSISVLRRLNELGYGNEGGPEIDLVFNHPLGPFLPPCQSDLEVDYKRELDNGHGVTFNRLLTITNMPIGRYLDELKSQGKDKEYMKLLTDSFNASTVPGLMCRHQINIGWDGTLYDCDFNQALGMPVNHGAPDHIDGFEQDKLIPRQIVTGSHCFACTAGAGSSCGGSLD